MSLLDASSGDVAAGFILWALILGFYFVPGIVASSRKAKNAGPVWVVNIFLGWTVVGWVVALAMAAGEKRPEVKDTPVTPAAPTPLVCKDCGTPVGTGAFCSGCGRKLPTTTAV